MRNPFRSLLLVSLLSSLVLAGCTTVSEDVLSACPHADEMMDDEMMTAWPPLLEAAPWPSATAPGLATAQQGDVTIPLRLGTLLPKTGSLAVFGGSMEKAAILAVEQINDAGGVNGRPVAIFHQDSQTDPTQGPPAFDALVNDGVVGVIGAAASSVTASVQDRAISEGVLLVTPASTAPSLTDRDNQGRFARVPPSDSLQGVVLADLVYGDGCHSATVLAVNNAYGQGLGAFFESRFEALGGTVDDTILFDDKATTFTSEVQRAGSHGSDAIVFIGYPETGVQIMQESFERGIMQDHVFFFSEGVYDATGFVQPVGDKSDGDAILTGLRGTTPHAAVPVAFSSAFQARWGEQPTLFAAETYDAVVGMALAAAYAKDNADLTLDEFRAVWNAPGQRVTSSDLSAALVAAHGGIDIDYVGVSNDFDIDENGDATGGIYDTWIINADGTTSVLDTGIEV